VARVECRERGAIAAADALSEDVVIVTRALKDGDHGV